MSQTVMAKRRLTRAEYRIVRAPGSPRPPSPAGRSRWRNSTPPSPARNRLVGPVEEATMAPTGSDVGSLFPFIEEQVVKGEPPLSYLRPEFQDPAAWKRQARGKLLELLHY